MWEIAGLQTHQLIFCLIVVFLAAIVRGYAGFGFTAIVVICLSFILEPVEIVPVLILMEIAASVQLLPSIHQSVNWAKVRWISIGIIVGIAPGVYLLSVLPGDQIRIILSGFVLVVSLLLLWGFKLRSESNHRDNFFAGSLSGLMTGATGTGGLALVSFFIATSVSAKESRANLAILFLSMDLAFTVLATLRGLITADTLIRSGLFLAPLFLGVYVGTHLFQRLELKMFRTLTTGLLMILSSIGLTKALLL